MSEVVVLGAGFGGLEISSLLSQAFGEDADVVLIDHSEDFVFGFSKLDVMFGKAPADHVRHRYQDIVNPGVRFVQAEVTAIDPVTRRVDTTAGSFTGEDLVIALGADLAPDTVPGLETDGNEFYSVAGAFAARDVIASFGGGRVVVGVTSTPFKCPPAPSETALLMHDHLVEHGLREASEISLAMPFPVPLPPSPDTSEALLASFAELGINWVPGCVITSLDTERRVAVCSDGNELPYDLFLAVPPHVAPAVVIDSGLTTDGWIPVDFETLQTQWPHVYAVGDVTSVGTAKAGVFSEGQARIVAERLIADRQRRSTGAAYDGSATCYLEFGRGRVGEVDIHFPKGEHPHGQLHGPGTEFAAGKASFGSGHVARWFGKQWLPLPAGSGAADG